MEEPLRSGAEIFRSPRGRRAHLDPATGDLPRTCWPRNGDVTGITLWGGDLGYRLCQSRGQLLGLATVIKSCSVTELPERSERYLGDLRWPQQNAHGVSLGWILAGSRESCEGCVGFSELVKGTLACTLQASSIREILRR